MSTSESKRKNPLFNLIDRAPFAGKFIIKDAYVGYETAPDEKKVRRLIGATALLSFMVAAHAYQSKLGIDSLTVHLPHALEEGDSHDIMYSGVDSAYALAMGAVAVRQGALLKNVGRKHIEWLRERKVVAEEDRVIEKRPYVHKKAAMALAVGATLTGQIVGSVSMIDAKMGDDNTRVHSNITQPDNRLLDNDISQSNRIRLRVHKDTLDPADVDAPPISR